MFNDQNYIHATSHIHESIAISVCDLRFRNVGIFDQRGKCSYLQTVQSSRRLIPLDFPSQFRRSEHIYDLQLIVIGIHDLQLVIISVLKYRRPGKTIDGHLRTPDNHFIVFLHPLYKIYMILVHPTAFIIIRQNKSAVLESWRTTSSMKIQIWKHLLQTN